jgi:hypothetical protein
VSSAPPQVRELVERFARRARVTTVGPHEQAALQRQVDRLVYELYGLTDEEIKIVEAATRGG